MYQGNSIAKQRQAELPRSNSRIGYLKFQFKTDIKTMLGGFCLAHPQHAVHLDVVWGTFQNGLDLYSQAKRSARAHAQAALGHIDD